MELIEIWKAASWRLTQQEFIASLGAYNRFITCTAPVEGMDIPKKHLSAHLVHNVAFLGNPRYYANWIDEALNKLLKACCRGVSQATFESSVLSAMQLALMAKDKEKRRSS